MLLSSLVDATEAVRSTASRSEKVRLLAEVLASLAAAEIDAGAAFLAGRPRQSRLGVGKSTIREIDAPAASLPRLTLAEVDAVFASLEAAAGPGSAAVRRQALVELFRTATKKEQQFLRRLILRDVRKGASEGLLLEAIAAAHGADPGLVRRVVMLTGDPAEAERRARAGGNALRVVSLSPGRPLRPMLARAAATIGAALDATGPASVEVKLDGARIQAHITPAGVSIFTRNLHDVTASLPEVVEAMGRARCRSAVFDGECIALRADGRPHPFQVTMDRSGPAQTLTPPAARRRSPWPCSTVSTSTKST